MRFIFLAVLASILSACASRPAAKQVVCDETKAPFEIDTKNIEQTADISGRLQWCGYDYEPFYFASMQFERLDACKTQIQLAQLGYTHGGLYKTKFDSLADRKCEASDRQKLKQDYDRKLGEICRHAGEREQLEKDCKAARNLSI